VRASKIADESPPPASSTQIAAPSVTWRATAHGASSVTDLQRPNDDLHGVQRGGRADQPEHALASRSHAPPAPARQASHAAPITITRHHAGHETVQEVAHLEVGQHWIGREGGQQLAVRKSGQSGR
jgi:hypothetical protein